MMQRIAFSHILSCVLVFFIFSVPCLVEQPLPFLSELELKSIDLRFKVRGDCQGNVQMGIFHAISHPLFLGRQN